MAFETFAVHAACIRGVEAIHVTVEVSLAGGVPGIQMLGIPSMEAVSYTHLTLPTTPYV